jgi:DNA adenine methylase
VKPFFKWSGGKRKEIPVVEQYKPKQYEKYYEPFVGGGAVWLHLEHANSVVSDNYGDMVNFYEVLKSDTERLVNKINDLSKNYSSEVGEIKRDPLLEKMVSQLKDKVDTLKEDEGKEKEYKEAKKELKQVKKDLNKDFYKLADKYYYHYRDNEYDDKFDQAVKFYMLRQLSFSGMLRFGSNGKFNIPYGWYKSFKGIEQPINDIKKVLQNTTILNQNWKDAVKTATKDDFVFLDPPYTRTFTQYHPSGNFGEKEHRELADWFSKTTAKVMIIINKDELTKELYGKYIKCEYDYRYSIQYRDRMQEDDSNAIHILATNYDLTTSEK